MIIFDFTFRSEDDALSGLSLGEITLSTGSERYPRQPTSRHLAMLYISLSDLIRGVLSVVRGKAERFEFIGADSAVRIDFRRLPRDEIEIVVERRRFERLRCEDLLTALRESIKRFDEKYGSRLPFSETGSEDYRDAVSLLIEQ